MRDIGKNIRTVRIRQNMTQDELAEKLFVTRQTVSNYETGRSHPDIESLMQIAEVLGVEINTLLYGMPESPQRVREKKQVIVLVCILAVIGGLALIFAPKLTWLARTYYIMHPWVWIRAFLLPALCFALGWVCMQAACVFLGAKLPRFAWKKIIHIALTVFLVACTLLLLPWFLSWTYYLVRDVILSLCDKPLGNISAPSVFRAWDVLASRIFFFLYRFPYVTLPFGIAWKLTERER